MLEVEVRLEGSFVRLCRLLFRCVLDLHLDMLLDTSMLPCVGKQDA